MINSQPDAVLQLLETSNVDGRSGLEIFIQTFCENAETFQGDWPNRQSTLALLQLYSTASQGRASLKNMIVKGDLIIKPETKNGESFLAPRGVLSWGEPCMLDSDHDAWASKAEYGDLVGGLIITDRVSFQTRLNSRASRSL